MLAVKRLIGFTRPNFYEREIRKEHNHADHIAQRKTLFDADQSAEIQALDVIEERGETQSPPSVARKILDDNPRRFYGL